MKKSNFEEILNVTFWPVDSASTLRNPSVIHYKSYEINRSKGHVPNFFKIWFFDQKSGPENVIHVIGHNLWALDKFYLLSQSSLPYSYKLFPTCLF